MIVDKEASIATIKKQLADCVGGNNGWSFSEIDETNLSFHANTISSDGEPYILKVTFDNYPHWPPLLDFVDPITKAVGVATAYPYSSDNFFNKGKVAICHPCSRKAYKGYAALHKDWGELETWRANSNTGQLTNMKGILDAIYYRIIGELYVSRMEKRAV